MMKFKNMLLAAALLAVAGLNADRAPGKFGSADINPGTYSSVLFHLEPNALILGPIERVELKADENDTSRVHVNVYDKANKKTYLGLIKLGN
jgi:hypothetical protein